MEYESPLLVHSDTPVAGEASFEWFESVAGWYSEVFEVVCRLEHLEFAHESPFESGRIVVGVSTTV